MRQNTHSIASVWRDAWRQCQLSVINHRRVMWVASVLALSCMLYPSNLEDYRAVAPLDSTSIWLSQVTDKPVDSVHPLLSASVDWVEHRGRFIATAAQILIPLIARDWLGCIQLVYLSVATTTVTHVFKRAFNDVHVAQTPIGERPNGGQHNSPSGHSSMAASALGFLWRRYGVFHLYYLLPIVVSTMATRVLLSAHTISAVFAGALIGLVMAYVMTTPKKPPQSQ